MRILTYHKEPRDQKDNQSTRSLRTETKKEKQIKSNHTIQSPIPQYLNCPSNANSNMAQRNRFKQAAIPRSTKIVVQHGSGGVDELR